MVNFTEEEIEKIPSDLRPLMDRYPLAFDNLLEFFGKPPMAGPFETLELYFDDELRPALTVSNGTIDSSPATRDPICLTLLADDECCYMQIGDHILLNRVTASILQAFEV
jgi:hypothetical protein